jgi:23S rRNA (adenine2503-C2)-methyltransferase
MLQAVEAHRATENRSARETERRELVGMDVSELRTLLGPEQPSYRARQLYDALYREQVAELSEISVLPKQLRNQLITANRLGVPSAEQRFTSKDGTRRYLLRLADHRTVEAVLMPEEGRDTICISSQVGCPVDCKFCLTALMGLERNLSAGEILGQVMYVARENGLRTKDSRVNVVMMGMGEPLLNLDNVLKATRLLTDPAGFGMSPKRITLSTSGIVPKIEEMGRAEVRPKLAISLNASSEEQRRDLMPITRKYHLKDLMQACRAYPLRTWERLTFEYVLLKGVNDSDADARRVVRLIANLSCKVNLIALNPGPGIPFDTPDAERVESFQQIVRRSVPCFVRKPRGRDIFAACGQLKRVASQFVEIG